MRRSCDGGGCEEMKQGERSRSGLASSCIKVPAPVGVKPPPHSPTPRFHNPAILHNGRHPKETESRPRTAGRRQQQTGQSEFLFLVQQSGPSEGFALAPIFLSRPAAPMNLIQLNKTTGQKKMEHATKRCCRGSGNSTRRYGHLGDMRHEERGTFCSRLAGFVPGGG